MAVKHDPNKGPLQCVFEHWDATEELCDICRVWWMARSNAFRKEVRHTYEFEADV